MPTRRREKAAASVLLYVATDLERTSFSRLIKMPDDLDVKIGFSLEFRQIIVLAKVTKLLVGMLANLMYTFKPWIMAYLDMEDHRCSGPCVQGSMQWKRLNGGSQIAIWVTDPGFTSRWTAKNIQEQRNVKEADLKASPNNLSRTRKYQNPKKCF